MRRSRPKVYALDQHLQFLAQQPSGARIPARDQVQEFSASLKHNLADCGILAAIRLKSSNSSLKLHLLLFEICYRLRQCRRRQSMCGDEVHRPLQFELHVFKVGLQPPSLKGLTLVRWVRQ